MKIEVYKDCCGKLHEKKEDYIVAEAKYQSDSVEKTTNSLNIMCKKNPVAWFDLIRQIALRTIKDGLTKEEIEETFQIKNKLFRDAEKIINNKCGDVVSGDIVEHKPFMCGNDILPGYDVNR